MNWTNWEHKQVQASANIPKGMMPIMTVDCRGTRRAVGMYRNDAPSGLRFWEIHPEVDRLNAEQGTNVKIISPETASCLTGVCKGFGDTPSDRWMYPDGSRILARIGTFMADAIIGYEKPGRSFNSEIVCSYRDDPRVILPTGRYKGELGLGLVAIGLSAKDFKFDGRDIYLDIQEDRFEIVPDIPQKNGLYRPHERTTIPHGEEIPLDAWDPSSGSRSLLRANDAYAGPLMYAGSLIVLGNKEAHFYFGSSTALGMIVEVPPEDVPKLEAPIGQGRELQGSLG